MRIKLSDERNKAFLDTLQKFYLEEFDEKLSAFRAQRLLEYFIKTLGPPIYNQAISDARAFMQQKLDDLDVEYYESESTTKEI